MKNIKNELLLKHLYQLKYLGYRYTSLNPYTQEESEIVLPDTLEKLKLQAENCHLCTLSKLRNKVVFGTGNPQATVMIVGDKPSSRDDEKGEIFTGDAGELLSKMIEKVLNIPREKVYLTNLLKCTSLENKSNPRHIEMCQNYLFQEIKLIQPKLIITLGEMSYQSLSGDNSPLEDSRGQLQHKNTYTLLGTFHPQYLLRNPSAKKEVFEDLKLAKSFLES